jgi:hypothetical protein
MAAYGVPWLHLAAVGYCFRFVLARPRKTMVANGVPWLHLAAETMKDRWLLQLRYFFR